MTTTGKGKTHCDACIQSYFWNTLYWEDDFDQGEIGNGTQCVKCCTRCEDICDHDDEECVKCDEDGSVLETLDVRRGWWRASRQSLKVYECWYDLSCRGGRSIDESDQCHSGHVGALCGACAEGHDYEISRNRCANCSSAREMFARASILFVLFFVSFAFVVAVCTRHCRRFPLVTFLNKVLKEHVRAGLAAGHEVQALEDAAATMDAEEEKEAGEADDDEATKASRRRSLKRSIITKLKIIIAAMQIASSTDTPFWQVRFPPVYAKVTHIFGVLGVFLFDVGSFHCLFRWSYYDKIVFVTVAPFGIILLAGGLYWLVQLRRGRLRTDRRRVSTRCRIKSKNSSVSF